MKRTLKGNDFIDYHAVDGITTRLTKQFGVRYDSSLLKTDRFTELIFIGIV